MRLSASVHVSLFCLCLQVSQQLEALGKSMGSDGADLKALLEKAVAERSYVEVNGKPAPGFKYMTAADATQIISMRRKQVCRPVAAAEDRYHWDDDSCNER